MALSDAKLPSLKEKLAEQAKATPEAPKVDVEVKVEEPKKRKKFIS